MAAPEPAPARLEMRGIAKAFGSSRALVGVDLALAPGEVHALVGENGAGKSTLMKILSGAHAPDGGEMRLDGAPYAPRGPQEARARGVGMVYQELAVAPHLSVAENLVLGAEPRRGPLADRAAARRLARRILGELGRGEIEVDAPAGSLGQAPRQILEIGRALALGCRVIVFDEPTSSLGREDAGRLLSLIPRLAARGISVVYISHFLEEVRRVADRLTVLRDGRSVLTRRAAELDDAAVLAAMVGRDVGRLYPRSPRRAGAVAFRASVPGRGAIEVRRGEVLGICGLVGSGRTELLRAAFGLDPGGEAEVSGRGLGAGPRARWAAGVGFLSENRKEEGLALGLGVGDNLCLPSLPSLGRAGLVSPSALAARAGRWIRELGIRCEGPDQPVGRLSGGNQQKAVIGRWMAIRPPVLLLDEPTRGVDVGSRARIHAAIRDLADGGTAVVFASSELEEVLMLADRVLVMHDGAVVGDMPVQAATEEGIMRLATGGRA